MFEASQADRSKCGQRNNLYPSIQWRHNERDGVSNHRRLDCLLIRLFSRTPKLRVASHYKGNPPVTGGFPSQRASNEENVSIWWRHHGYENYQ